TLPERALRTPSATARTATTIAASQAHGRIENSPAETAKQAIPTARNRIALTAAGSAGAGPGLSHVAAAPMTPMMPNMSGRTPAISASDATTVTPIGRPSVNIPRRPSSQPRRRSRRRLAPAIVASGSRAGYAPARSAGSGEPERSPGRASGGLDELDQDAVAG